MDARLNLMMILTFMLALVFINTPMAWGMHDPTKPPGYESKIQRQLADEYRLTSTLVSADRRIALINDQLVAVGDDIDGSQVIKIKTNSVLLKKNGQLFAVPLWEAPLGVISLEVSEQSTIRAKPPWKK